MLYVIESRTSEGKLLLSGPQPESKFGMAAIRGINEADMAAVIFRNIPESEDGKLAGDSVETWPSLLYPTWKARPKTW